MTPQKVKSIAVKVVVTFIEGAVAYWLASGQKLDKVALSGAIAAGISAVYNVTKHYIQTN